MAEVRFRFYEELNDFLPYERRRREFAVPFRARSTAKDWVESLGVPHTEVDLILVNGESVAFDHIVCEGDRVTVYPLFEALDIRSVTRLRPEPLRRMRFVLDTHLGKLARHLRLLGFDTLYSNGYEDGELARISTQGDKRVLLTRDQGLLKRSEVTHGYYVRNTDPLKQACEVLDRFDMRTSAAPFTRCLECNSPVQAVSGEEVAGNVPEGVARDFDTFSRCSSCARVYWPGSHYDKLAQVVNELLGRSER